MMSNTTHSTPATTARKATTRVATRAGRDTGSTSFLRNASSGCASCAKLTAFPRSRRSRRPGDLSDYKEPLKSPFRHREPVSRRVAHLRPDRDVRYGAYATPGPLDDKIVMRGWNTTGGHRHGTYLQTYNRLRHVRVTSPTRAPPTG